MSKFLTRVAFLFLIFSAYSIQTSAQSTDSLSSADIQEMEAITRSFMASRSAEELSLSSCEIITALVKGGVVFDVNQKFKPDQEFNKSEFPRLMKLYGIPVEPKSSIDSATVAYDREHQAVVFFLRADMNNMDKQSIIGSGTAVFLRFKKCSGAWRVSSIFFLWN